MLKRISKRGAGKKASKKGWEEKYTIDGMAYYYNHDSEEVTWEKPFEMLSKEEQEDGKTEWVWIPHPTKVWQPAKGLKQKSDGSYECKTEDGQKVTIPADRVLTEPSLTCGDSVEVPLWPLKLSSLRMPEDDLVMLDAHNEALLIHNLRIRYEKDDLYTWVGAGRSVLISINPFKTLPLYGKDYISMHKNRPPNKQLKPHVFDIANDSYESMMFENKNQSVLISGESGAGKTVCTKQCLSFLAEVAGSESLVEEKILKANPLLEAFGNAQTIRNNNSSRFGKWIEVHFDPVEQVITSASIVDYLLEKSRVIHQQKNERNYHIFYQLTTNPEAKSKLDLDGPENYNYLNQSGCYKANHIDDVKDHGDVLEAMDLLEFKADQKEWVMQVAAGVLALGNIEFKPKAEKDNVKGSQIADTSSLKKCASYLDVSPDDLQRVLCYRSINVRGTSSVIPLEPSQARKACDSLAMGIYGRLFSWLVQRVNDSLTGKRGRYIGILDIFGFEIFEQNSFEQLCINFANEKLQQQFNRTTFKEEEALYVKEGIQFKHVAFIDNQIVLNLIEQKPTGILCMIDDEIRVPGGSDAGFMKKIQSQFKNHEKFLVDKKRKLADNLNFEIQHYAGVVQYNADGFMVKNTDTLFQDMLDMCSSVESMTALFPAEAAAKRKQHSLSKQFTQQLGELMESLYATESRYIRCVKPNKEQVKDKFESRMCTDQLRYSGVFEAVEIRKQGFPFRLTYAQFACRYSCINRGHRYSARDHEGVCKEILATSKQDFSEVQFGKTMVLYRAKEYKILKLLRNLALEEIIPKCQTTMRGHLVKEFKRRVTKAEMKLRDALDVANDIAKLKQAIDDVKPTIGTFAILFKYDPRNLAKAKAHHADLQLWKDLEHKLEELVEQDPNKVYYKLADAVKEGETLKHIPQTDRQIELLEQAVELRGSCELGKIDAEAIACVEVLDRERMEDCVRRADKHDHENDDILEIKRLLALKEIEFVQLELEKAIEMKDEERRIHREIRLKDLFLDENGDKYRDISQYRGVKSVEEFVKAASFGKKMFGGQKIGETMLLWTKNPPPTSLTALPLGKPQEKQAVNMAKNIRVFMGERKGSTPEEAAALVIEFGHNQEKACIDEIYLQILKQLRSNPEPESLAKGYELLLLVMSILSPTEDVERFTIMFLRQNAPNDIPAEQYTSALHENQYGDSKISIPSPANVFPTIERLKASEGSRYSVPRKKKRKNRKSKRRSEREVEEEQKVE
mmetsp:Transcript_42341/g.67881  ORF Transcript_42341/g.67881 Transcript_42341/m.67881 type:complete len:1247 (-) Transcript_42341:4136-7876(-)|eukprot:CAMPEP_0203745242 /NCGR_PEP_ID=MMETSP0098-20131031/1048_1 /ASSEMBLY_ACC=CAM_ASM_000208 /TAXON_ID=96639 /ORGANISM=" , Strain NY0313808BC1" /LENGTH=1246 /DNA_ID=CAMNT_0050632977 /DNA_START=3407 /DNA_END=7147 /DNA_ORIENTATION=-